MRLKAAPAVFGDFGPLCVAKQTGVLANFAGGVALAVGAEAAAHIGPMAVATVFEGPLRVVVAQQHGIDRGPFGADVAVALDVVARKAADGAGDGGEVGRRGDELRLGVAADRMRIGGSLGAVVTGDAQRVGLLRGNRQQTVPLRLVALRAACRVPVRVDRRGPREARLPVHGLGGGRGGWFRLGPGLQPAVDPEAGTIQLFGHEQVVRRRRAGG